MENPEDVVQRSDSPPIQTDIRKQVDFSFVKPHLSMIILSQLPTLLLSSSLLDFGRGFRFCVAAIALHWLAIACVAVRDRAELTKADALITRWGFFPSLLLVVAFGWFFL